MWFLILFLPTILDRATQNAETFWTQVSAIECTEQIAQIRTKDDGKVTARRSSTFDYVVTLKMNGVALVVEESRIFQKSTGAGEALLLTSGFPTLMLVFHPDFRDRFEFEVHETENRIAFRLKPGARSMSAIKLGGRSYPIRWQGAAWVDPANGAVRRIEATSGPMTDLGIEELNVVVEYGSVPLAGQRAPYWLPSTATISLRSPRQQWKNIHEFGSYKLFSVTSTTSPPSGNQP
jgi:hypothetical protein